MGLYLSVYKYILCTELLDILVIIEDLPFVIEDGNYVLVAA